MALMGRTGATKHFLIDKKSSDIRLFTVGSLIAHLQGNNQERLFMLSRGIQVENFAQLLGCICTMTEKFDPGHLEIIA